MSFMRLSNRFATVYCSVDTINIDISNDPFMPSTGHYFKCSVFLDPQAMFNFYRVLSTLSLFNDMDIDNNSRFLVFEDISNIYLEYSLSPNETFRIVPCGEYVVFTVSGNTIRCAIPKHNFDKK